MITSKNLKNASEYLQLFDAVEEYLETHDENGDPVELGSDEAIFAVNIPINEDGTKDYSEYLDEETLLRKNPRITSLNLLFEHMGLLRRIKPRFTRLPLDEPFLMIDANTRAINIPKEFVQNGLSVEGDEIAESIYFKINRYVDHMDLGTKNIFIQYRNALGEEKLSVPPVVDIESEPGFVIFEWPISSHVTAAAGNVTFSARFYDCSADEVDADGKAIIKYSLSSLPAILPVKASQNFDIASSAEEGNQNREDNKYLMENRLSNSKVLYDDDSAEKAEEPKFWSEYIPEESLDLELNAQGFNDNPKDIFVEAYSEDAGRITYSLESSLSAAYTALMNKEGKTTIPPSSKSIMVETTDVVPVSGKIYYTPKLSSGEIVGYSIVANDPTTFTTFDPELTYYEKMFKVTVYGAGSYKIGAMNSIGAANAFSKDEDNIQFVVPAAEAPINVNISKDHLVLSDEDTEANVISAIGNVPISGGKLKYQWLYKSNLEEEPMVINEANKETITIDGDTEQVNLFNPLLNNGDGYYSVVITNRINNTESSLTSPACRITHPASKPVISNSGITDARFINMFERSDAITTNKGLEIEISLDVNSKEQRTAADNITYEWYTYTNTKATLESREAQLVSDAMLAQDGEYNFENDVKIPDSEGTIAANGTIRLVLSAEEAEKGKYYCCKITNNYNGSAATVSSAIFGISTISGQNQD